MPMVMVIAVVGMVAAMVLSGMARNPMSFIFPLMMLGSVAMAFQPGGQDVDEIRRSFHRHLDAVGDGVRRARTAQQEGMIRDHPHPQALWTCVSAGVDTEPGVVRIGMAVQAPDDPLEIPVDVPPEDLEPVCAMSLRELAHRTATIEAPVAVDLREFPVVAVTGAGAADLVRAIQGALVLQNPASVTIKGAHDQWLPHDGPLVIRCDSEPLNARSDERPPRLISAEAAQCSVIANPDDVTENIARSRGLLLHAEDEVLSAWTVEGWRPFAAADHLSDVELAMICRARCSRRHEGSILDFPGGDLRAPIGHSGQSPVYLDIRESAKGGIGPHGLCIGATGSGKSELLRSVVTSFAHHHSADELNFVLIDFKGGAAFAGMERLPHTSALITNLSDEAVLVDRMQDALLGEMHRRQEHLRDAGLMTATEYNREHPGKMPSLFIVVDEFSELLHARPEFAEVFAAIGRLGRSLGLHLLLASQRLEEGRLRGLESHLSYRIALRTFSSSESRTLIGSTAAHDLPTTPGAAILAEASGAAEHIRFHSAYVSGAGTLAEQSIIEELGVIPEATASIMDQVINRLAGPNHMPIWLEPLPAQLPASAILGTIDRKDGSQDVATMSSSSALVVPVGLEDLPFDGVQRPLTVDLRRRHWIVVGSPGTGKTTFLRTLAVGLTLTSPNVAIYVFDPGGSLTELSRLPHVAAVVGTDALPRLLDEMEQDAPEGIAHRVFLFDGVDGLGEEDRRVATLVAGGLERGVHVVITALRWTFRPSLRDLFIGHVELKIPAAESNFRDAQRSLPDLPGRGISSEGRHMQIADSNVEAVEYARRVSMARGDDDVTMRVLPEVVNYQGISEVPRHGKVLLGLGGPALRSVWWDYATNPHLTVVGQSRSGVTTTLRTVIVGLSASNTPSEDGETARDSMADEAVKILVTDIRRGLLGLPGYLSPAKFQAELAMWVEILRDRLPEDVAELSPQILRERSWWSGPELVVVVDDVDHSADLSMALEILVPLLPYAADIGLHVVLGRRSASMARSGFAPLSQGIRDSSAWVVLSAPREDGPIAGQVLAPCAPGRGTFVAGDAVEVQVAVVAGPVSPEGPGGLEDSVISGGPGVEDRRGGEK